MALPMDEQRILEEMERMLAADDPRLASRLAAFGQPGVGQVLRTRRARAVLSLLLLAVIAAAAAVIYMMSAIRLGTHTPSPHGSRPASTRAVNRHAPLVPQSRSDGTQLRQHCVIMVRPTRCAQLPQTAKP